MQLLTDSVGTPTSNTEDTRGKREDSLGLGLGICDLADEDGVLWVIDVSLLLHVGGGDCEHCSVVIKSQ